MREVDKTTLLIAALLCALIIDTLGAIATSRVRRLDKP